MSNVVKMPKKKKPDIDEVESADRGAWRQADGPPVRRHQACRRGDE